MEENSIIITNEIVTTNIYIYIYIIIHNYELSDIIYENGMDGRHTQITTNK